MKPVYTRAQLLSRRCSPGAVERAHTATEIDAQLPELAGWALVDGALERGYAFSDFYDTIAFVNALAWIIHREDHHPELRVGYNRCVVRWNTHSVNGISENDFICAAKTDSVFARGGN